MKIRRPVAGSRAGFEPLVDLLQPLWPTATITPGGRTWRPDQAAQELVALPDLARPTVLLPLRPRRATAAVLRAHRSPSTTRQRLSQRAQTTLALLGAADLAGSRVVVCRTGAPGQESVITRLWPVLGRPHAVGLHLGPPRANRKPILQLLDSGSRDLAFVKVGSGELTRPLVLAEGKALSRLSTAGLRRVVVPAVLHAESWQGSQLLVLAPVATTSSADPRPRLLTDAMVEVCDCLGRVSQPLATSTYWADLGQRLEAIDGPMAPPLRQIRRDLEPRAQRASVGLGAWHGDWTPWNMSWSLDQVVVWDWERFTLGVPAGFDALHFELQSTIRRGGVEPRQAIGRLVRRAPELLAPFRVAPEELRLLVSTYLLELATRYVHDRQDRAGARLGDLGSWLLPELASLTRDVAVGQPR